MQCSVCVWCLVFFVFKQLDVRTRLHVEEIVYVNSEQCTDGMHRLNAFKCECMYIRSRTAALHILGIPYNIFLCAQQTREHSEQEGVASVCVEKKTNNKQKSECEKTSSC